MGAHVAVRVVEARVAAMVVAARVREVEPTAVVARVAVDMVVGMAARTARAVEAAVRNLVACRVGIGTA